MNPRNLRTSETDRGRAQSFTLSSLDSCICILPCPTQIPRNSISSFSNTHFSAFKNRSLLLRILSMRRMMLQCCSRCCSSDSPGNFHVCTHMSSMYTVKFPSLMSSLNNSFIIVWKVASELVRPKNIMVGSNNPSWVRKAAFHLSPLIHILLYPH